MKKVFNCFFTLIILVSINFSIQSIPLDSIKVKTIDGKTFILHKVDKGQGLLAIGRRYNIDVRHITEANPGKTEKLKSGDKLLIPVSLTLNSIIEKRVTENENKIQVEEKSNLKNNHEAKKNIHDTINKNEIIKVEESHANADSKEKEVIKTHVVSKGESLKSIAAKYKITPQLITRWNGLQTTKIEPGQELIVDGSMVIKPYEKWNEPNSISGKNMVPKNILSNAEKIAETGLIFVNAKTNILHKTIPVGTLLLVTDLENGNQCYVKITGKIENSLKEIILVIDEDTQKKLSENLSTFRAKIEYISP